MFLLLGIALLATSPMQSASAEPAAVTAAPAICSDIKPNQAYTKDELESASLCQEISKLKEEVKSLQVTNETTSSGLGRLIPWSGVFTAALSGLVALLVTIFGSGIKRSLDNAQTKKLDQERTIQREEHNLRVMGGLGSTRPARQLAAASAMLGRIRELAEEQASRGGKISNAATSELKVLSDVAWAIILDKKLNGAVTKYIAEGAASAFNLLVAGVPGASEPTVKLSDYNLSGARLSNVYWARIVAENVDFFGADLSEASLRNARLKNCKFYDANLQNAVLEGADLAGANFEGAQLQGARLKNTNLDQARNIEKAFWDETTSWPEGFQIPVPQGAGTV